MLHAHVDGGEKPADPSPFVEAQSVHLSVSQCVSLCLSVSAGPDNTTQTCSFCKYLFFNRAVWFAVPVIYTSSLKMKLSSLSR